MLPGLSPLVSEAAGVRSLSLLGYAAGTGALSGLVLPIPPMKGRLILVHSVGWATNPTAGSSAVVTPNVGAAVTLTMLGPVFGNVSDGPLTRPGSCALWYGEIPQGTTASISVNNGGMARGIAAWMLGTVRSALPVSSGAAAGAPTLAVPTNGAGLFVGLLGVAQTAPAGFEQSYSVSIYNGIRATAWTSLRPSTPLSTTYAAGLTVAASWR